MARSVDLLTVWLAQNADDIDAGSKPFEHHPIVAGSQPGQIVCIALQFRDSFSVRNGIVRKAGAVGKNLMGDLVREGIEVALGLFRQEDLAGHAVRARFLPRFAL